MARTIKGGFSHDVGSDIGVYKCACGHRVTVPIQDLVPDEWIDYCGCGESRLLLTFDQVASQRPPAEPEA